MKFFNIDLHISVIEDIKTIFSYLGHQVDSWSISGHSWVFNRPPNNPDIINQTTFKNIDQSMCDRFYQRYQHELSNYDGFIVTHTPVFALLFEKFNKPIICVASTRYEQPFSNNEDKWSWLNDKLRAMIDSGQIIAVANNKYDKFYCELFLDREFIHIPSLCDYTNERHLGIKNPIVAGRLKIDGYNHISSLGRFSWKELYSHKAIIHIPYNVSIMSIFEQYTANVPMFFPTIRFGKKLSGYLSELFFKPNLFVYKNSILTYDTSIMLSDFYDQEWMPFIQYFDSIDNLNDSIEKCDFEDISKSMQGFNKIRKKKITKKWEEVLKI